MGKTIAVSNLKGGVGKTMTAASLGVGLANKGKRVLCLDADAQHSLTVSLGIAEPDKLAVTLSTIMSNIISDTDIPPDAGIIRHAEGIDLLPSNNTLAGLEIALVQQIGRETVLRQYIEKVKPFYDYIIIDCAPSLDLMTINALAAADSIIVPVVPKYLDAKGLELLLKSITQIKRQINPSLSICGILLTLVDKRSTFTKKIISLIENAYGERIRIFKDYIPISIRAVEASASGKTIFSHDPGGKIAVAYASLAEEVLNCG